MPITILLIEDELLLLLDLQMAVEEAGHIEVSAGGVDAALKHLETRPIDVAILDVHLGLSETSFPIAKRLREQNIPYLFYTAQPERLREELMIADVPVIIKPADTDKIVAAAIALI